MIGRRDIFFFVPALLFSILTPLFAPPSSVSLSYFILAVPMRKCLGKHSCMSSPFPIAIMNGTFYFRSVKAMNNWKRSAIKQILLLLLRTVMVKWLAGQTAVLTARVRIPHECRFSVTVQGHCTGAFYDAITGPTEFINSIVNSVTMVNMPWE